MEQICCYVCKLKLKEENKSKTSSQNTRAIVKLTSKKNYAANYTTTTSSKSLPYFPTPLMPFRKGIKKKQRIEFTMLMHIAGELKKVLRKELQKNQPRENNLHGLGYKIIRKRTYITKFVSFHVLPFPVAPSLWFRKWLRSCCACKD